MARGVFFSYPIDQPAIEGPGFRYRESDYPGSAKHLAIPAEHPLRTAKGDLGLVAIPNFEPRPLSHEKLPFVLRKK